MKKTKLGQELIAGLKEVLHYEKNMKAYGSKRFPAHGVSNRRQCQCGDCSMDRNREKQSKTRKKRARRQAKEQIREWWIPDVS